MPKYTNALVNEDSPYLQQHKHNPVNWLPWCDEAFERAKLESKAIFISIGYSSCHWCHVMEHKVFEDEIIAEHLNQHFICIKVDKEERPDIDKYYQDVHLLLNRRAGGWPTSIFCTPQNKPFFAGTYIPPESQDRQLGFNELVTIISTKISENDQKLFDNADEIQGFLKPDERPTQASEITIELTSKFIKQAVQNFEFDFGGFSSNTKFPHTSTLQALFNFSRLSLSKDDTKESQDMLFQTMDNMVLGGMYDHVDGGFCRYSVDKEWLIPHFEKMCYDNGLLISLYAEVGSYHDKELYTNIAKQSADFMMSKMMKENLFYSASDADSEDAQGKKEEGTYFVYDYKELYNKLSHFKNRDEILTSLNITQDGNFEGKNIIRFNHHDKKEWFKEVKVILSDIRATRNYPFIDKKVQTSWNAMLIKGFFDLSKSEPSYLTQAINSLEALLQKMYHDRILHHTTLIGKEPKEGAYLEDYAYLGSTLVSAYALTYDKKYLQIAQEISNKALELFYDSGRWYFSRGEFETDAEIGDGTYTSSISIMIDFLLSLGALIDDKYHTFAFKSLEYYSYKIVKSPLRTPHMSSMAIRYLLGDCIIKTSKENCSQLNAIDYPYVIKQENLQDNTFMLCKIGSCFAQSNKIEEIDNLVSTSMLT